MGIGRALGRGGEFLTSFYLCVSKTYHVYLYPGVAPRLPTRGSLAPVQDTMRERDHYYLPHSPPLPSQSHRRALIHEQLCPLDRNATILSYHTKSTMQLPTVNSEFEFRGGSKFK